MPKKSHKPRRVIPCLLKDGTVSAGDLRLVLHGLTILDLEKQFKRPEGLVSDGEYGVAEWRWKDGAVFGVRFIVLGGTVLNVKFSFRQPFPSRREIKRLLFSDGQYEIVRHGGGIFLENRKRGVLATLDVSHTRVKSVGFAIPHVLHAHDTCDCPGHETVRTVRR